MALKWSEILSGKNVECPDCSNGELQGIEQKDGSMLITCSDCELNEVFSADLCNKVRNIVEQHYQHALN